MEHHELTGEARDLYESWRRLGHSEAQALDEVRRSGIAHQQGLEDMFRSVGLSEAEARVAARGRDGGVPPADPFEQMYNMFLKTGMSEAQARAAAIGRDGTEYKARQKWAESVQNGVQESAGRRGGLTVLQESAASNADLQETFRGLAKTAREIQESLGNRPEAEAVLAKARAIELVAADLERQAGR